MRLSRRSEYGLRALVDLVRHEGEGPVALAVLAERNRLPAKFLEQIMASSSTPASSGPPSGAHGGYAMAADPSAVSLGRVIRLLDGALAPLGCVSLRYYEPCSCVDEATCPLRDTMIDVRDAMLEILDARPWPTSPPAPGAPRSTRAAVMPTRSRGDDPRSISGAAKPRGGPSHPLDHGGPVAARIEKIWLGEVDR